MKNKIWIAVLLVIFVVSACSPKVTELTGADREAILAFSEAKTDNLLAGLNAGDYAAFSADFDADMLAAIGETQFEALKTERATKVGSYLSRSVDTVFQQGEFYVVVYKASFEKADSVTVRVVFRAAEPHQVSGLWFNP